MYRIGWLKNGLRYLLVTVGIILLTSFTIDAVDTVEGGPQTALSIFTDKITTGSCPKDMVAVNQSAGQAFCIDVYEVSPSDNCVVANPKSTMDTTYNMADARCLLVSEENKVPWTFVTASQAKQLCAKAGKRLPTSEEWFAASLGTPDSQTNCNLKDELRETGSFSACISGSGVYDMVGNVWELVEGEVLDGIYKDIVLPKEGYVLLADETGMTVETASESSHIYNDDYFWSVTPGRFSIMKGGYYGSRSDGGIYTTHAGLEPNFASAAIGFRCSKSL